MHARCFIRSYQRSLRPCDVYENRRPARSVARVCRRLSALLWLWCWMGSCVTNVHAQNGSEVRNACPTMLVAQIPPWLLDAYEAANRRRQVAPDTLPRPPEVPPAAFISRHRAPSATMSRNAGASQSGATSAPAPSVNPTPAQPAQSEYDDFFKSYLTYWNY